VATLTYDANLANGAFKQNADGSFLSLHLSTNSQFEQVGAMAPTER
jgi:hypothetical protein